MHNCEAVRSPERCLVEQVIEDAATDGLEVAARIDGAVLLRRRESELVVDDGEGEVVGVVADGGAEEDDLHRRDQEEEQELPRGNSILKVTIQCPTFGARLEKS